METISQELFHLLADVLNFTEGKDFYLYRLPSTKTVQPQVWWLVPQSQNLTRRFVTGERDYLLTYILNYRSTRMEDADNQTAFAQDAINNLKCFDLPNYGVVTCMATATNTDEDIDTEDMCRGSVVITLRSLQDTPWVLPPDSP